MPIETPFHPRTSALAVTYRWKDWSGYLAVCTYDISPEREYNAVRQGAGLFDATPLYKYEVRGRDAGRFLSRVMVRDVARMKVGRVSYLCWCDDHGKVLDDGTCARLSREHFRVSAAAPSYEWFMRHASDFDVSIEDSTEQLAVLALQGPTARALLTGLVESDMDTLRFFGLRETRLAGVPVTITRTGYTGDLGYELWIENQYALPLWDALMEHGRDYGLMPIGLDTLDICRVEAGFIMQGVDYHSAHHAMIESQKSSPFEIGLGWTVQLDDRSGRGGLDDGQPGRPFVGAAALAREKARGSEWAMVGLDIDWPAVEALYAEYGLPPALPAAAWRSAVPVYRGRGFGRGRTPGRQVGRATSGAWSPILKQNLALATVRSEYAAVGTRLDLEMTVEWERRTVPATVVETPFFNPPRKRA